ncbi:hypothetical protein ABEB36_007899 [Hypothenemus hampei]|uniref:Uncharacterized protein n=1 Tax=Hypothenemus hampei TaxID=57062 RepID=A0ABD1EZE5_HYPHA
MADEFILMIPRFDSCNQNLVNSLQVSFLAAASQSIRTPPTEALQNNTRNTAFVRKTDPKLISEGITIWGKNLLESRGFKRRNVRLFLRLAKNSP